jgi:hypothetical protein
MVAKIIRHKFQSAIPDGGDATLVRPQTAWNGDAHDWRLGNRTVSSTTDAIVTTDELCLIKYTIGASNCAVSIAKPDANNFTVGWTTYLKNKGTGTGIVTISPTGGATINGGAAAALRPGENGMLTSDGTNFDLLVSPDALFTSRGQFPATSTNDNAAAGNVGEYVNAFVPNTTPVALVNNTAAAIFSLPIPTGGDWDITGFVGFNGSAATAVQYMGGAVDATANSVPSDGASFYLPVFGQTPFNYISIVKHALPTARASLAGPATYYCNVLVGFTPGSVSAFGSLRARRMR